jgi:hypothetical protein
MKVSSRRETPILATVRILRRLLRKAFLVTNRLKVIAESQGRRGALDCGTP